MRRIVLGVVLVTSLAVAVGALAGPVAAADPPADSPVDGTAVDGHEASDGQQTIDGRENRTNQTQATCDYVSLYEETISSVVQVQLHGTNGTDRGGLGSGFVFDREGNVSGIVTNHHVVQDRETVTIEFSDGESRIGDVVGTDAYSDLAVVEVTETPEGVEPLPVATDSPRPGEPVAALGSPFGLEGTITEGIVSAVDRPMPTDHPFTVPNTVQTDAPINPGNSGGPLVDCTGTVVGVNTAGGGQNIGFAIGPSLVERVVPALIEDGEFDHAYLGIRSTDVSPTLAAANDLENTTGVYVHRIEPDGPADDDLQGSNGTETVDGVPVPVGGDVIVAIDGQDVRNGEELSSYLATAASPGDEVEVTVIRDGERTTVSVTLGERPPLEPESTPG